MKRKVLVIGGNRFFGLRLVKKLVENGDDLTLLNRGKHGDDLGNSVQRIICDRTNANRLHEALEGRQWDLVYDQVCFDAEEAKAACEVFRGKTRRYIFTSSQSVYHPGQSLREADYDPNNYSFAKIVRKHEDYSEAKRQCEAVFFKSKSMPVSAVRFPIVIGPDDFTERLDFHVRKISKEEPLAVPNLGAKISFIHSEDAAQGLFLIGNRDFVGPLNMAAQEPITIGDFISSVEVVVGKKALISDAGELSPYGIEADWFMDVTKALSLGFKPKPIRAWLNPTIAGRKEGGLNRL